LAKKKFFRDEKVRVSARDVIDSMYMYARCVSDFFSSRRRQNKKKSSSSSSPPVVIDLDDPVDSLEFVIAHLTHKVFTGTKNEEEDETLLFRLEVLRGDKDWTTCYKPLYVYMASTILPRLPERKRLASRNYIYYLYKHVTWVEVVIEAAYKAVMELSDYINESNAVGPEDRAKDMAADIYSLFKDLPGYKGDMWKRRTQAVVWFAKHVFCRAPDDLSLYFMRVFAWDPEFRRYPVEDGLKEEKGDEEWIAKRRRAKKIKR
jgi:hypothetical protein